MRFSFVKLDVADKVGIGFFCLCDAVFGDKDDGIGHFNAFGRETGFISTLCRAEKFVCGGDFSSRFLGDGLESVERGFGTYNGVVHRGSSSNNGTWLIAASVSSWVPMWR